ncbi:MAG TPA: hypothetical protein PLO16_15630, partial [Acidocella sp.]|nr:hypothetical protein [Acidocella sp.]
MFAVSRYPAHGIFCGAATKSERAEQKFVTGDRPGEWLQAARHGVFPMAKTVQKITLSASRDIPFDRLVLSQSN